jgi:hypothetical protein
MMVESRRDAARELGTRGCAALKVRRSNGTDVVGYRKTPENSLPRAAMHPAVSLACPTVLNLLVRCRFVRGIEPCLMRFR